MGLDRVDALLKSLNATQPEEPPSIHSKVNSLLNKITGNGEDAKKNEADRDWEDWWEGVDWKSVGSDIDYAGELLKEAGTPIYDRGTTATKREFELIAEAMSYIEKALDGLDAGWKEQGHAGHLKDLFNRYARHEGEKPRGD